VTLCAGDRMWEFLYRLLSIALSRRIRVLPRPSTARKLVDPANLHVRSLTEQSVGRTKIDQAHRFGFGAGITLVNHRRHR